MPSSSLHDTSPVPRFGAHAVLRNRIWHFPRFPGSRFDFARKVFPGSPVQHCPPFQKRASRFGNCPRFGLLVPGSVLSPGSPDQLRSPVHSRHDLARGTTSTCPRQVTTVPRFGACFPGSPQCGIAQNGKIDCSGQFPRFGQVWQSHPR